MDKKEIKKQTYRHFQSGFACAEVVSKTILDLFSDSPRPEVIRAASGFNGGIAGTQGGLCGAFTGGIIVLGSLTGRAEPGDSLKELGVLIRQYQDAFLEKFGSINCPDLIRRFGDENDPMGCVKLTAGSTVMLTDILHDFETANRTELPLWRMRQTEKIPPGCCPYAA